MKKVILFIFSFLFLTPCFGQFNTYHPFPGSYAVWSENTWVFYNNCSHFSDYYNFFSYYTNGDTLVGGKTYIKVRVSGGYTFISDCNITTWLDYDSLACLLRDDKATKKVYASYKPNFGFDTLLYDFSLHAGDYLPPSYGLTIAPSDSNFVYSIDSILVGSTYRKQFIVAEDKSNPFVFDSIIEGIGSAMGLLEEIFPQYIINGGSLLSCFSDSSISITYGSGSTCKRYYLSTPTIQKPESVISVYPNPSNGKFTLQMDNGQFTTNNEKTNLEIYNALGQQIFSKWTMDNYSLLIDLSSEPNGIYFYRVIANDGNLIGEGKLIIQK